MVWYSHLSQNFPQFIVIHRGKGFGIVNKAEIDNHDIVITNLEPAILECEVKWALETITINKTRVGDGILVELFQILKDDAVKVLYSIYQQIWTGLEKVSFIPLPKKGNAKEISSYHTIAFISHASKVMLKILQARLQQ